MSAAFTYPFRYAPSEEIRRAANSLIERIDASSELRSIFGEGKMMGVLQTDGGFLYAFSGLAGGRSEIEGFVGPIFDYSSPEGYYRRREKEISQMEPGEQKARSSRELQDYLFSNYIVSNALGNRSSIKDIFALRGLVPPSGTGECAAPKLLQHAYDHSLKPIAMGEFWYGEPDGRQVHEKGRFYPSCTGKCGPLLSWMMQGLDVEPNPLDSEFCFEEPSVVFADEDIIVVNKPSGMLSVPGRSERESLTDILSAGYGEVHSCHRLDMDTSGLMVFARNMRSKVILQQQFANGEVKKCYRSRLSASPLPFARASRGTIALPLCPDYYERPRQMVDFEHGKLAVTRYELISVLPDSEIDIRFFPQTGRTHQLRVHAAHPQGLGRPIKGDKLYGSPDNGRLYLHAESLEFTHPRKGTRVEFSDPMKEWN